MEKQQRTYGLFTTIAMIVGVVIGSGIYFKTDNILTASKGNVALGVLIFCIAAFSIIFGCLTISNLAALTDKPGGVIAYSEEFVSKKFASSFGWFQTYIYYPTLTVVVSWVVGIYITVLFNLDFGIEGQIMLGFCWFAICYCFNIYSAKIGGVFQNISTVVKLFPILVIGIIGIIFGDPVSVIANPTPEAAAAINNLAWVSAVGAIAFSFDGWVVSTVIASEVKDAKRNLPIALIVSPLLILFAYLIYFIGISAYVGPEKVMALGDKSISFMATSIFGKATANAIIVFVVISVMGTVNGLILGFIRLPHSLATRKIIPGSNWITQTNGKHDMPIRSGIYSIAICLVWWVIHYVAMKFELLPNSDISEISIAMSYLLYIVLYVQVFRLWRQGKIKGVFKGVVFPIFATIGSLFILLGGLQNSIFLIFIAICVIVLVAGYFYKAKA